MKAFPRKGGRRRARGITLVGAAVLLAAATPGTALDPDKAVGQYIH
jgi:hypothetical protein